jgi:molybdopterin-guanine dinucleotide biosynthesis protein A
MIDQVAGVILAGGLARRMGGGDKALLSLAGRSLVEHIVARLRPQVVGLVLNANGEPRRFAAAGVPVVPDDVPGFPGPLAGILAGMEWAVAAAPACPWIVSVPGDAPLLPLDLVSRLVAAAVEQGAEMACAASDGQNHPVVGLWPVGLAGELRHALVDEDIRRIDRWTARYRTAVVEWPVGELDPFYNVNTPEDLARLEGMVTRHA